MARGKCIGRGPHHWMPHPSRDETRWIWCGMCGAEGFRFPGDGMDEYIAKRDAKRARCAWLAAEAAGTLQEWLPGYATTAKIVAVEPEGTYRIDPVDPATGLADLGEGRSYRVKIQVEEVADV